MKLSTAAANLPRKTPLPVTLLSGFLGAGKTSLLQHILESNDHKLKIAVIVNDMAELNIDSSLIEMGGLLQTEQEIVSLQNGCICCTLRTDLINEINRLQDMDTFDYVVIESTGIAEPQQVAESFCADPETAELAVDPSKMLWNVARLDTCVTVVDSHSFPRMFNSLKAFNEEFVVVGPPSTEQGEGEEGEKNIASLLVEQVEFANIIVVNKTDLISTEQKNNVITLLKSLNPKAKLIDATFGKIDISMILNTQLFDLKIAKSSPGWLESLKGETNHLSQVGEADEYGVSSFVYRSRKPFHPARLNSLIESVFYHTANWESRHSVNNVMPTPQRFDIEEEDTRLETMLTKFGCILRSKGFCWIAGRDSIMGGWAQSGRLLSISPTMPWYADTPEDEWGTKSEEGKEHMRSKFVPVYGDRRQEIVFIGTRLQEERITMDLNSCLLTDEEFVCHDVSNSSSEGFFFDPLPAWILTIAEPALYFCILRCGQISNIAIDDGVELKLCNISLNIVDQDVPFLPVKVWLDSTDRKSSILLCTLRPETREQHSVTICLKPNGENYYTLRMEEMGGSFATNSSKKRRLENTGGLAALNHGSSSDIIEVHVVGTVIAVAEEESDEDSSINNSCSLA